MQTSFSKWHNISFGIVFSLIGPGAYCQMTVAIPASPHPNIRVSRLAEAKAASETSLASEEASPLYNASLTLHNDDRREVVGICVLWKITDKSGHTSTAKMMMDEFLSTVKNSVILPGGTLDVSPIGWLSSLPPMMPGQRINAAVKEGASRVADAARITASVDSVIFEDGETWGPNSCHLDQEIAARKVAAAHVAELVKGAVDSQNDVREVLHQLARAPFNPATDFQAKWEARFADQMLSRGGDIGPQLRYLQKLPTPPELIQRR